MMARIYITEPGTTGGIGALGMRILLAAMRRAGHDATRVRFYRKPPAATQRDLFAKPPAQVADASSLARPDAWFISLLNVRQFWQLPDLFRRMGLALWRDERGNVDPLVAFGGSAMIQPAPVAAFADVIALGDGEATGPVIAEAVADGKRRALNALDGQRGFWVTSNSEGQLTRLEGGDRDPLVRPGAGDTVRHAVEVARGCRRKCVFCPIGWAGGTYREAPFGAIARAIETLRGKSANFFAADFSSVRYIGELEHAIQRAGCRNTGRDARLDQAMINIEAELPAKAYSFGIEGMTERLRRAVLKPISDERILETMAALQSAGVGIVRWYMILALPSETDGDAEHFTSLLGKMRDVYHGRLEVTMTHFQPLAHTPLQWVDGHYSEASARRLAAMFERIKASIVSDRESGHAFCDIYFSNPTQRETHDSDGYLYRAGPEAAGIIARVDSVAAKLKDGRWREGADIDGALRERQVGEPLPWDNVHAGIPRSKAEMAYRRFLSALERPAVR
jgi:radical SAM superfamily enzyme YgiQ (UPF0313 family)